MGILTSIFDFITSFDGSSYIEDAKGWGDDVWNDMDGVSNGVLSLAMIENDYINSYAWSFSMVQLVCLRNRMIVVAQLPVAT